MLLGGGSADSDGKLASVFINYRADQQMGSFRVEGESIGGVEVLVVHLRM